MFSMRLGGPALVLAFALAGCATGLVEDKPSPTKPAQDPPASPSSQRTQGTGEVTQAPTVAHPSPSPTAEATGLDETGSDLLFRLRQTPGGASDALRSALMVPIFSLYADGTAIYWNARLRPGRHEVGLQTAVLSPTQVQSLLEFALEEGGLAQAKSLYRFNTFGPSGSTIFEINAPELTKRVVYQLGISNLMASREPEHASLKRLADRLRSFWHDVDPGTRGRRARMPPRNTLPGSASTDPAPVARPLRGPSRRSDPAGLRAGSRCRSRALATARQRSSPKSAWQNG